MVMGHLNARSLMSGFNEFSKHVQGKEFSICEITESCLTTEINNTPIHLDGYDVYRRDGQTREGGILK